MNFLVCHPIELTFEEGIKLFPKFFVKEDTKLRIFLNNREFSQLLWLLHSLQTT